MQGEIPPMPDLASPPWLSLQAARLRQNSPDTHPLALGSAQGARQPQHWGQRSNLLSHLPPGRDPASQLLAEPRCLGLVRPRPGPTTER